MLSLRPPPLWPALAALVALSIVGAMYAHARWKQRAQPGAPPVEASASGDDRSGSAWGSAGFDVTAERAAPSAETRARGIEMRLEERDELLAAQASELLAVAEKDPERAIAGLAALDLPWAQAWAGFFEIATASPRADARERKLRGAARIDRASEAMHRTEAGYLSPRPHDTREGVLPANDVNEVAPVTAHDDAAWTVDVSDALFAVRIIGERTSGSENVPCWIAHRWPEAWVKAYDAYHGSSLDAGLPTCTPTLDQAWIGERAFQASRFLGVMNSFCGSIRYAYLRSMDMAPFEAWYTPRAVLDNASNVREFHEAARADLLERLDGNRGARDRWIAGMAAPAAWRRKLEARARSLGLSPTAARTVVALTVASIEANAIEAELACGYEKDRW